MSAQRADIILKPQSLALQHIKKEVSERYTTKTKNILSIQKKLLILQK